MSFLIERFFKKAPQPKTQELTAEEWEQAVQDFNEMAQNMQNMLQDPKVLEEIEDFTRKATYISPEKMSRRIGI